MPKIPVSVRLRGVHKRGLRVRWEAGLQGQLGRDDGQVQEDGYGSTPGREREVRVSRANNPFG